MKNWQKSRNYRRVKNENGEIIANIITVDGVDVEVTEEVFLAYSQMDRRERYLSEDTTSGKVLSLDQMAEDDVHMDYVGAEVSPSAEECCLELEDKRIWRERRQALPLALEALCDVDRELIIALFYHGVSTRAYARQLGVTQRAVVKRRDRIIRDLNKFFEKSNF